MGIRGLDVEEDRKKGGAKGRGWEGTDPQLVLFAPFTFPLYMAVILLLLFRPLLFPAFIPASFLSFLNISFSSLSLSFTFLFFKPSLCTFFFSYLSLIFSSFFNIFLFLFFFFFDTRCSMSSLMLVSTLFSFFSSSPIPCSYHISSNNPRPTRSHFFLLFPNISTVFSSFSL